MSFSSKYAYILAMGLVLSGCRNLYRDFSHKTSSEYLIYESEKYINKLQFSKAIENLDVVIEREELLDSARYLKSIAHSGRAGLRVVKIFETIQSGGAGSLFSIFSSSFELVDDDDLEDFAIAVANLELVGPLATDRNVDQNFYALFLYLGRIGAVINRYAYDTNNLLLSANFSACHTLEDKSGPKTGIPDDQVDVIMTMIPRTVDTVETLGEQGAGVLIDVSSLTALGSFDYDPIPCSDDPDFINCLAVRSIVNNSSTGVGLGTGASFPPGEDSGCLLTTP